jgi:hypothetical protein
MSKTISVTSGDGVTSTLIQLSIQLPDAGTSVVLGGIIFAPGAGPAVTINGSPLTIPATPAAGSIYYIIQVNLTTGTATVKQSTSVVPTADANNQTIFTDSITTTDVDPALNVQASTPDTY